LLPFVAALGILLIKGATLICLAFYILDT